MKELPDSDIDNVPTPIRTPFLLKFLGTIILVISTIWFLYYTFVGIYQVYNPMFLESLNIDTINFTHPTAYITFNAIFSLFAVVSTLLVLKINILGLYGIVLSTIFLSFNELLFGGLTHLTYLFIHIIFSFVVLIYYKKFRKSTQ